MKILAGRKNLAAMKILAASTTNCRMHAGRKKTRAVAGCMHAGRKKNVRLQAACTRARPLLLTARDGETFDAVIPRWKRSDLHGSTW